MLKPTFRMVGLALAFLAVWVLILYCAQPIIEPFMLPRDPVLFALQQQLATLDPIFESVELYPGNRSYTIDKRDVYICLKDENGEYYDRNMLAYVILHEYAHLLCTQLGHGDQFVQIFNTLLKKAAIRGLYDPSIPPLRNYCGVTD